jgi:hypothetical protein
MQALFFASSGTRSRSSDEKVAVIHQQDSGGFPVALENSWAQRLGSLQMGHFEGSITLSIESLDHESRSCVQFWLTRSMQGCSHFFPCARIVESGLVRRVYRARCFLWISRVFLHDRMKSYTVEKTIKNSHLTAAKEAQAMNTRRCHFAYLRSKSS